MDYQKTNWVNEETPVNAENLNNIEDAVETLTLESHTHNNKPALDTLTVAKINQIEHSNRSALDTITTEKINQIHTHSNKAVIDTFTQVKFNQIHEHSNKSMLDEFTREMLQTISQFKVIYQDNNSDLNVLTTYGMYGICSGAMHGPPDENNNSAALLVLPAFDGIIQVFIPYGVADIPNDRLYIRTLYQNGNHYEIDCDWFDPSDRVKTSMFALNETTGVVECGRVETWGADNAKYFEWADGNPEQEERIGLFVTLEGDKIKIASAGDEYILGIVSGMASFVGNAYESWWNGRYLKDIYGRNILETVVVPASYNKGGKQIKPVYEKQQFVLNPDYDSNMEYIPRSERPEWDIVGINGIMVLRDDGSCSVNEYCKPAGGGIATAAGVKTLYRVLKRLDETHIQVLVK